MTDIIDHIIVYVDADRTASAAVESAGRIAEHFGDAAITGIYVKADPSTIAVAPDGGMMHASLVEEMEAQEENRAQSAQAAFESALDAHGWSGDWQCIQDRGISRRESIARAAHLCDLVVVGQTDPRESGGPGESIVPDLTLDVGRPVLLIPHDWRSAVGEKHVMIAWKHGREATRAVHDALPFLGKARTVTVTAATPEESDDAKADPGAPLCEYLAGHGIAAESRPLHGIEDSAAGNALLAEAERIGADLMVLGAYSHSRLREGLFGGVTRDVIDSATVPALFSH